MRDDPVNRDEFLDLGTHCSHKACVQLDFLPFKCPCCALPFCQLHWRPENHPCTLYDPVKADNRIPSCPLCNAPIPHPPNADPNISMDHHFSTSCPILLPHLWQNPPPKPKPSNVCHAKRCQTKMVVEITCPDCGGRFCAAHRWGRDHACEGRKEVQLNGKAGGSAGLAALRRAQMALKAKGTAAVKVNGGKGTKNDPIVILDSDEEAPAAPKPKHSLASFSGPKKIAGVALPPVSKVDRRALAERASARKALENRAKKGLLSEEEKLQYATAQAMEAKGTKGAKGKDCVVS